MVVINNVLFQNTLQDFLNKACAKAGKDSSQYEVRQTTQPYKKPYKKCWHIFIQNFNDIYAVKRIKDDKFIRYSFKFVLTNEDEKLQLIVAKWTPSMGSGNESEIVFEENLGEKDDVYLDLMVSALQMPVTNLLFHY